MLAIEVGLETILASTVPQAYAAYRRPLAAALGFFLDHLSADRAAAIVGDQLLLPPSASNAERLFALARRSPTLHKLGQILARDRRMDAHLRRVLQRLESMPSRLTAADLRPLIEQELRDLDRLGIALDPVALAEASIAVVVGFTWQGRRGVFKLLKPGVQAELTEELAILDQLGAFLDDRCAALGLRPLDYRDAFAQVRELLSHEVRLDGERRNLAEAAGVFGRIPRVHVPLLFPFQSPRLLAMERIEGRKVTEARSLSPPVRRWLAGQMVEALIATPAWSAAPLSLFHGDPHAGNLMIDTQGRLVVLDWSLGGHLDIPARSVMSRIFVGATTRNVDAIVEALESLAVRPPNRLALRAIAVQYLRALPPLRPPGVTWLKGLLDEAVGSADLRVSAQLLAFRKALLTLDGVLADIAPDFRIRDAMLASFLTRLVAELPQRALLPPEVRVLPTRISNADFVRMALALPRLALSFILNPTASTGLRNDPKGPPHPRAGEAVAL